MSTEATREAATWWERHLAAMVSHEQDLQRVSALRAVMLGLVATTIAVGGPLLMAGMRWWGEMSWLAGAVLAIGYVFALGSAIIFWLALAPMEGRGWRPHTLTAWLHQRASTGLGIDFLAGLLPSRTGEWRENLRQARRLRPDLSAKVRAAVRRDDLDAWMAHQSQEARELVVDYLHGVVGSDLAWWLDPEAEGSSAELSAARVRMVFWLWLHRHVAQTMADMLWLGVKLGVTALAFVVSALTLHWIGWWLLLLIPLAAGLGFLRWAFLQAQP